MAVNIIKKIVSMEVTKEDVVDRKMLKPFARQAVLPITSSSSCTTIKRVAGDGPSFYGLDCKRCLDYFFLLIARFYANIF